MTPDVPLFGLDIETDTTVDGLDPELGPIVSVAIDSGDACVVHSVDPRSGRLEADILVATDATVRKLPPGVLVTWNGAAFDLPFLRRRHQIQGIAGGPTQEGDDRWTWAGHRHLDAYLVYRSDVGRTLGFSCGLKNMSRLVGLDPVMVDRSRIHELSADELEAYVASDARLTRDLALRRWTTARAWIRPPLS